MRKAEVKLDIERLQESAEIMRALAHPLRMKILEFIDQQGSTHVNKIYNTLQLEQSITSQHLRVLRLARLVHTKREGKYVYYSINYPKLERIVRAINRYLAYVAKDDEARKQKRMTVVIPISEEEFEREQQQKKQS